MPVSSRITSVLGGSARALLDVFGSARLSILIFHRVHAQADSLSPGEPDALRFDALMRFVAGAFHVVTLGEALSHLAQGSISRRMLAITFDDGYADNAQVALPILLRHGLRATFFVSSGFIDGGRMWNDSVIECVRACAHSDLDLSGFALGRRSLNTLSERRQVIDVLLPSIKYLAPDERAEAVVRLQQLCAVDSLPTHLMMRSSEVRALHDAGMEIGGHTVSHPILTSLTPQAAEEEIARGRERLESIIDSPIEVFAFPNGKPGVDYDLSHVKMVERLGFRGAVSTAPGVAQAGDDRFQLPRYTPWGKTLPLWAARLLLNQRNTRYPVVCADDREQTRTG